MMSEFLHLVRSALLSKDLYKFCSITARTDEEDALITIGYSYRGLRGRNALKWGERLVHYLGQNGAQCLLQDVRVSPFADAIIIYVVICPTYPVDRRAGGLESRRMLLERLTHRIDMARARLNETDFPERVKAIQEEIERYFEELDRVLEETEDPVLTPEEEAELAGGAA